MVTLFVVIGSTVLQCLGNRWCEVYPATMFHYMWQAGLLELMVEVPVLGSLALRIYRKKSEKLLKSDKAIPEVKEDTQPIKTIQRD